jgi:ankyrin repeat protein
LWATRTGVPQTIPHTLAAGANINHFTSQVPHNWDLRLSPLRNAVNKKYLAGDVVFDPKQRLIAIPGGCIVLSPLTDYDTTIKILLDNGADPNFCGDKPSLGDFVIDEAARNGDIKLVKLLLDHGAKPNGLFGATDKGHANIVELLLDHGADPNSTDRPGTCVLYEAAKVGAADVVKVLLRRGADVNTSLGQRVTALHYAALGGNPATIRLLVDKGLTTNAADFLGRTPLHWAALQGRAKSVEAILEIGASPDIPDTNGYTPLLVASNCFHTFESPEVFGETVDLLLNAGADINARDRTGKTTLHLIIGGRGWGDIPTAALRILVDRGVDVSVPDNTGRTALMVGLRRRRSDRDELLDILGRKSRRLTKKPRIRYEEDNDE